MMISNLSKYIAIIYSIFKGHFTKLKNASSGNVLIVEGGHIGDALMDAPALAYMAEYYVKAGNKVYLLCTPQLWHILKKTNDFESVEYVGDDYSYDLKRYDLLRKVYVKLKNIEFKRIIGIHNADSRIHCIISCLNAGEKWGIIAEGNMHGLRGSVKKLFLNGYTKILWGNGQEHQFRWTERLFVELKIDNYRVTNARIRRDTNILGTIKPYITIAVDSANSLRRWPARSFIDLISSLLNSYRDDIYLIGKDIGSDLQEELLSEYGGNCNRIINLVGKTSLNEWIDLIHQSRFLVGVDSGSIHIAAAVGTPAFCLTGVWDGHKCMPYDVDEVAEGTALPICIYRQDTDVECLPCFNCNMRGKPASCNEECAAQVKDGGPFLCLSRITPDDVMQAISVYFSERDER